MGFLCEDLDPTGFTQTDVNSILFSLLSNIDPNNDQFTEISLNALKCEDEDILTLLAEILDTIAKLNYDYIGTYINQIDALAHICLDKNHLKAAKLAIGIWSTIAEEEYRRE